METYLREEMEQRSEEETANLSDFRNFAGSDLTELIKLFRVSAIGRMSVESEEVKVKIVRRKPELSPPPKVEKSQEPSVDEIFHKMKPVASRYLGILHLNSPKGVPYTKVGEKVKQGQILATVETLNIQNDIKAERSGVVMGIFEKDGRPVEYGQILFLIDPE
jgi:acetyl-CoA carboxylase biotin carboxyl carrier protein